MTSNWSGSAWDVAPMPHGDELIERARLFAIAAHGAVKQTRKYTGKPYIVHPEEVAGLVKAGGHSAEMIAAAWLHDVVEDTGIEIETIWAEFGSIVASYVWWLTDISKPSDGNREARKAIDRKHLANAPDEVKTVKLADLISNTRDIMENDPAFVRVYLKEKILLLEVLQGGDPRLYESAADLVERYSKVLKYQKVVDQSD